jgi:hypothetical protein
MVSEGYEMPEQIVNDVESAANAGFAEYESQICLLL